MRVHVLAGLMIASATAHAAGLDWARYTNDRFGASAEVPAGLFIIQPPPDNNDGRTFRSRDDGAVLRIYGGHFSALSDTFAAYATWSIQSAKADGLAVTYQRANGASFVYSGRKGDTIVYVKTIKGCEDVADTVEMDYPAASKSLYDPIVTRIAASLEARRGIECR